MVIVVSSGDFHIPTKLVCFITTLLGSFGTFVHGQGPMHRNCSTLLVAVRFGGSSWLYHGPVRPVPKYGRVTAYCVILQGQSP